MALVTAGSLTLDNRGTEHWPYIVEGAGMQYSVTNPTTACSIL